MAWVKLLPVVLRSVPKNARCATPGGRSVMTAPSVFVRVHMPCKSEQTVMHYKRAANRDVLL